MADIQTLGPHEPAVGDWELPPRKRMRVDSEDPAADGESHDLKHRKYHEPLAEKYEHLRATSTNQVDPQVVGSFMVNHVPAQYNPQGTATSTSAPRPTDVNTKFCYRHRPDMLCRRQADEPTMEKLQRALERLPETDRQGIVQVWSLFSAAPSKHRNLMLQGVLTQCCFPQLSFLSTNVQQLIKIDFLSALPAEISFRILSSLDTISLCKAAQVSRKWRQLADDDVVWHRMCEQHINQKCTKCGWGLPLLDRKRLRASKRQLQLRAAGRGINQWSPAVTPSVEVESNPLSRGSSFVKPALTQPMSIAEAGANELHHHDAEKLTRPWKHVYRDRFRVGKNWKHGLCSTKILKGHTNGVMALQIHDNFLATGSYDTTIKIWDLNTGKEVRTLQGSLTNPNGHTDGIRCLQMDDNKLISGSMDHTLKIWNWHTGECKATLADHEGSVIGLHFDANILVSGSADNTAKVWNFKDKSRFTLRGHTNWVNSVRIDTTSRTVFTASDDFTVKLWDLDARRCIRTFEGHVAMIQQVVLMPPECDADDDTTDTATLVGEHTPEPESPLSHHTAASQTSLPVSFTGHESPELTQHLIPPQRQSQVHDTYTHTFNDPARPSPPKYILSSALDSTIRLWNTHTGTCIRTFFGHVEGVWALAADNLRIVSGANDRMLKVWDPKTGRCERTFTGHTGPVTCIGLSDEWMVSGGEDGEARVYCFKDEDGHRP